MKSRTMQLNGRGGSRNRRSGTWPAGPSYRRCVVQRVQVAIDCEDPDHLAAFWARVLGYELAPPPTGYSTWAEHNRAQAEEPGEGWIKIVDPTGRGPTLLFHRVPER